MFDALKVRILRFQYVYKEIEKATQSLYLLLLNPKTRRPDKEKAGQRLTHPGGITI